MYTVLPEHTCMSSALTESADELQAYNVLMSNVFPVHPSVTYSSERNIDYVVSVTMTYSSERNIDDVVSVTMTYSSIYDG